MNSHKSFFCKISIWFYFETPCGKFGNSTMSKVLASCFIHKNFTLKLSQLWLRNVWNFRGVRFSRLHVLSTNWGLLIVIGCIPTKHAFGKFQCDIISNFVEESLEIQICQKISPPFLFKKSILYLNQVSLMKVWNFRSVRISHLLFQSTDLLFVIGWIPKKHCFAKFNLIFFFRKSLWEVWKLIHVKSSRLFFHSQNIKFDFKSTFVEECLEIQRCQISRLHVLSNNWGYDSNRMNSHKACIRKVSIWYYFELRWGKFGTSLRKFDNVKRSCPLFYSQKIQTDFKSSFVDESFKFQNCQNFLPACFIY